MRFALAGLVFLAFFVAAWRVASWFFRGVKNDGLQDEGPITGYSDPVRDGRMRW